MAMLESVAIFTFLLLMLLLIIILILFYFKPWRFFSFSSSTRSRTIKVGDLERPLVSYDVDLARDQSNDLTRDYDLEGAYHQNEALLHSPRAQGLIHKQWLPTASPHLAQTNPTANDLLCTSDSLVLDVISDILKCRKVVSGPSRGLRCYVQSTITSRLPLTLGKVSPSDLLLKDSEKLKWELVDMGSLNGTLLNSQPINHPDSGSRHWGYPMELASGDTITLGTTSNIYIIQSAF
ncbi:hypothetical protein CRYUN_Cryun18bG0043800 [Craigia yunnanensis]